MASYDPFGIYGGSSGGTKTATNYTGGTKKSNAGRVYDPFKIDSIDAIPNPNPKPTAPKAAAATPKPSTSLFSKVKNAGKKVGSFTAENVVNPVVDTGKAVGDAGAAVAGKVTGNKKATSNATKAYKSTYEKSAANAITSPVAGLVREDIVDPAKTLTAQVTGNKGAQANAEKKQRSDSTLRKTVSNSVGTILDFAAPGASKAITKNVEKSLVKKGASKLVANRVGAASAGVAIGAPMGADSVVGNDKVPLTTKDLIKGAGAGALIGGVTGGIVGEHLDNKQVSKVQKASAHQAMQTAAQNHLLEQARKFDDNAPTSPKVVSPDTVAKHAAATPEHVTNVNKLISAAHSEDPAFQSTMSRVAEDHGLEYHAGPVKSADRTFDKVMEDYGGDHTQVKDSVRGTITLHDHSPKAIKGVVDAVSKQMRVLKVKNLYKGADSGYRDVKLMVETPTGHRGEIILATPEMLQAKHELGGHELYQKARDQSLPEEDRLLAGQQMQALYDKAHADTQSRLASSSDLPASTSDLTASSMDTRSEPAGSAPTSAVTPDTTLVSRSSPDLSRRTASTTSSGVMKNVGEPSIPSSIAESGKKVNNKSITSREAPTSDATTPTTPGAKSADAATAGKPQPTTKVSAKPGDVSQAKDTPARLTPSQTAHMDEVGGYTHSEEMTRDYADMLREQEKQAKGGQMVEDNTGHGTPTYKRITEHSKFYREYYKEHGKAPTKAAYLEEAKRQLESGHAAYGASEDYKKLVEREAKPIPKMNIDTTPVETGGGTKKSKLATGVEAKAVKAKLTKSLGDLPEYSTVNMAKQAEYATELLAKDPEKAKRIALGQDTPPNHILPESVYVAVENKALAEGDIDMIRQLATSNRVGEASVMGQRIRALAERNPDSAVSAVKTISDARKQAYERRTGKTTAKAVAATTREIKEATPKITKETWESFIDGLKC